MKTCPIITRPMLTGILVSIIGISGCGHQESLTAIPADQRIAISILPLADLTGQYAAIQPFDSLALASLSMDFVETDEPTRSDNYIRAIYQNPFKPKLGAQPNSYTLSGDVERIEYLPYQDIEKMLDSYTMLGSLLYKLFSPSRGDMAALVQYRFLLSGPDGNRVDSFLVVGVDNAPPDKVSRRSLVANANCLAAYSLAQTLLKSAVNAKIVTPQRARTKDIRSAKERKTRYIGLVMDALNR